ncbi:MAG TPA: GFA family protein [Steroidobacteraceae bacterium]
MKYTGGCLCGQVRFEIAAAPIVMRLCWCRDCQYFAAGNATVNVVFPSNALTVLQGELHDYVSTADSGNRMHRRFCSNCGTPVFSAAESRPHLVIVRNGALDDTELLKPSATIWTESAPEWAWIDETLPRHAGQPPPVA